MIISKKKKKMKGQFGPPSGKLDTQMFPECEGTKYDRNIVEKTEEKRKSFNLRKYLIAEMKPTVTKFEDGTTMTNDFIYNPSK